MRRSPADTLVELLLPVLAGILLFGVGRSLHPAARDQRRLTDRAESLRAEVGALEAEVGRLEEEVEASENDPWYVENELRLLAAAGVVVATGADAPAPAPGAERAHD